MALAAAAPTAAHAAAHPPADGAEPAKVLVQQALALIANAPDDHLAIEEQVHLALEAEDQAGVDHDLLEAAEASLAGGDLGRTRELLLACIDAGPVPGEQPPAPAPTHAPEPEPEHEEAVEEPSSGGYAVGTETGTTEVLDPYHPSRRVAGGEAGLLALSIVAIGAGAYLSWRMRPTRR
jgi:hypothetical protein